MEKMNLELDEVVTIHSTNSDLDGKMGTNMGKSTEHIIDFYIIQLNVPLSTHKAVTVPESCLKREHF